MRWNKASLPPLKPIQVKPKAWWRIHADILGPLTMSRNGNQYIAIAVDALTKYIEAMRNFYSNIRPVFLSLDPKSLKHQFPSKTENMLPRGIGGK